MLLAITNNERMRVSAATISSIMPATKYSCAGSPSRLMNGITASFGPRSVEPTLPGLSTLVRTPSATESRASGDCVVTGHTEAIAAASLRLDVATAVVAERPPERGDGLAEIVLFDDAAGPEHGYEPVLVEKFAWMLDHQLQCGERASGQRDARPTHPGDATPQRIEHKFAESVAHRWRVLDPLPEYRPSSCGNLVRWSKYRTIFAR